MKHYRINQHQFRNFCIGIIFASLFVLWAFSYERVIIENIPEIRPIDTDPYEQIYSIYIPEPQEKEDKQEKQLPDKPFEESTELKLVDDFKELKTIVMSTAFNFELKTPIRAMPMPVLPTAIEVNPDVFPEFPGGKDALKRFLENNVRYPETCLGRDRSGIVAVKFVVDEEGNISDAVIVKDELQCTAGYEALRVMNAMPKWTPGKKNGNPVKTYFIQTIRFTAY